VETDRHFCPLQSPSTWLISRTASVPVLSTPSRPPRLCTNRQITPFLQLIPSLHRWPPPALILRTAGIPVTMLSSRSTRLDDYRIRRRRVAPAEDCSSIPENSHIAYTDEAERSNVEVTPVRGGVEVGGIAVLSDPEIWRADQVLSDTTLAGAATPGARSGDDVHGPTQRTGPDGSHKDPGCLGVAIHELGCWPCVSNSTPSPLFLLSVLTIIPSVLFVSTTQYTVPQYG
jgi:hypothetical protein